MDISIFLRDSAFEFLLSEFLTTIQVTRDLGEYSRLLMCYQCCKSNWSKFHQQESRLKKMLSKCIITISRAYSGVYPSKGIKSTDFHVVCGGCTVEMTERCGIENCTVCHGGHSKLYKHYCSYFGECTNKILQGPGLCFNGYKSQITTSTWIGVLKKLFANSEVGVSAMLMALLQCIKHNNKFQKRECAGGSCQCAKSMLPEIVVDVRKSESSKLVHTHSVTEFIKYITQEEKSAGTILSVAQDMYKIQSNKHIQSVCPFASYRRLEQYYFIPWNEGPWNEMVLHPNDQFGSPLIDL